jgi:hypothetical protein
MGATSKGINSVLREGQGDSSLPNRTGTTSAVEGQQAGLLEEKQAGLWEAPIKSDFLLDAKIRLCETFDWPDHLTNFFWLLRGKKQVWFDYLVLLEYGLSGAQLEEMC